MGARVKMLSLRGIKKSGECGCVCGCHSTLGFAGIVYIPVTGSLYRMCKCGEPRRGPVGKSEIVYSDSGL